MQVKTMEDEGDVYRNKGGVIAYGKIIKGTLSEAQLKLRVSSIPNKHQNIIYHSNNNTAFGTCKHRSNALEQKSNTPGPGRYDPLFDQKRAESKKGSGFFASQSKMKTLQRQRSHIPGPGQYKIQQLRKQSQRHSTSAKINENNDKQPNCRSKLKFDVGSHQLFKNELQDSLAKPGVGTYNLNPQASDKKFHKTSAFKSSVQRFSKQIRQAESVGIHQIFESRRNVSAVTLKKEVQKPQSEKERQKKIINAIKSLDKQLNKESIGPGAYNPMLGSTTKSFRINENMYDRFGDLKPIYQLAKNIEPGNRLEEIESTQESHKRMLSTFMSTTKKWDIVLQNQMDPGKYNTSKMPQKKSHLVNFGQKWV